MKYYQKTARAVCEELGVNPDEGLGYSQVKDRLTTFGPNVLAHARRETLLDIFVRQFKSPLIYILIFAAMLVIVLGQSTDALVILAVITINAVIGTVQEGRAKNSLERLRSLIRNKALVRRNGEEIITGADEVVPGDILIVHEGDKVVADARITAAQSLTVDESILTGEAYTVAKSEEAIRQENLVYGDQKNMLFSGTSVASGYGEAVVIATGFESELGKISKKLLETASVPLPLSRKIVRLTHLIAIFVFLIAAAVFIVGFLRGIAFLEILGAVIGLSVSMVPEGLPVAVTVVLARGVWRMSKNKAIVRQMAAVEAMGNADTLLIDKTGTITTGKMEIRKVEMGEAVFTVGGTGYVPRGEVSGGKRAELAKLKKMMGLVYLSLKADVVKDENSGFKAAGDPTEAAIAVVCRKLGLVKEKLEKEYKTVVAWPFDSKKRYIEAVFKKGRGKWKVYVGAPEFLSRDLKIDHRLSRNYQEMAEEGLRVVGAAIYGPDGKLDESLLLAIEEEIREEVKGSVVEAKAAGFRVVVLTGDYPETARAIARKVGIFEEGDEVVGGSRVEELSEDELARILPKVTVFARITPEHKLKIVNAYKKKGFCVAMTGDGVNDGPALQAANLGIGLGSGTQVAKDSADIVLTDDNFSTIVAAISEGRNIYITLKKVILYLFSTSLGEVLVIGGAVLVGLPLPLVAVQIIWLNFVTDGFFVLALAQEPPEKGLISRAELRGDVLIDRSMVERSILMALVMLLTGLPIFVIFSAQFSLDYARGMALLVLSSIQWFNALNVRSKTASVFKTPLNNPYILLSFAAVAALQFFALETALGNKILHVEGLKVEHWVLGIALATSIIWAEEVRKWVYRLRTTDYSKKL